MELSQVGNEDESIDSKSENCTEGQSLEDAIAEQLESLSALSISSSSSSTVKKMTDCPSPTFAAEDSHRQGSLIDDRCEMLCCADERQVSVIFALPFCLVLP